MLVQKNKMVLYKEQVQFLKNEDKWKMSSKLYVKNTIKHFKCVFDMIGANIFVKKRSPNGDFDDHLFLSSFENMPRKFFQKWVPIDD